MTNHGRVRAGRQSRSLAMATLAVAAATARAQPAVSAGALVTLGGPADERARLDAMWDRVTPNDSSARFRLLRAPSEMTPALAGRARGVRVIALAPEVIAAWNSRVPFGGNDGALWAGRGTNVLARAGVAVRAGRLTVIAAPELTRSENLGFQIVAGREPGRSTYSSPWHLGTRSADLPLRFGDAPLTVVGPGQSSATLTLGAVALGAATENEWWGPGRRNALVMSDNAQGVPRLFVRTARPVATPVGEVEARLIVGGLTESIFFDTIPANDYRALSGVAFALRPRGVPRLTVGAARTVVSPVTARRDILGHAADALVRYESLGNGPRADSTRTRDQLFSLFARWAGGGFEAYAEWARTELPRSGRELLLAPQHTQAYTLGVARAVRTGGGVLRVAAELSDLEQSRALTDRPDPPDYYTGRAAAQGYTQRGQVLGAAIGPGASAQHLAADFYATRWLAGLSVGRTRYENDALYRQFLYTLFQHDVGLYAAARAGVRLPGVTAVTEVTLLDRVNYLFQNLASELSGRRRIDAHNVAVTLRLTPR